MSSSFIGLWELVLVLFFGVVALPTPIGVPPLPEDPALLRMAPANSLAYVQWFGTAVPDPQSKNLTERLTAEPEVQELVRRVLRATRLMIAQEAGQDPMTVGALELAQTALASPGCLFITDIRTPGPDPMSGGLILKLGEDSAKAAALMQKVGDLLTPMDAEPGADVAKIDGVSVHTLRLPEGVPPVAWATVDGYLMLTMGEGIPTKIIAGLRGGAGLSANAGYAELHGKVQVARPSFRSFIDLERILKISVQNGGDEVKAALTALGFHTLRALHSESGLEGTGFTTRTLLATSGAPTRLLELATQRPLAAEDLAVIPADATVAAAVRFEPRTVYRLIRAIVGDLAPDVAEFDRGVEQLEAMLGVRLEQDLLAHIGDTFTVWNSPGQGGVLFTGASAAFSLNDGKAFGQVFAKVMARIQEMVPAKERDQRGRFRRGVYLQNLEHHGVKIYYLNTVGDDVPFAPAWCATDTHLLFSLFPQMLKDALDRGPALETSLASSARSLVEPPRAVSLSYMNARSAVETAYPILHLLGQLAVSQMQREGFDLDISALPRQGALLPHLGAETSDLTRVPGGFLLTRQGTIPVADPMFGLALPVLASTFWLRQVVVQEERVRMRAVEMDRARAEFERARRDAERETALRKKAQRKKAEKKKTEKKGKQDRPRGTPRLSPTCS